MPENQTTRNTITATPQLRASPMVLGITPHQLRGLDAPAIAAAYRNAARQLADLADELDGGV